MNTYQVEFYTTDGRRVGLQVSAYSENEAKRYAEQMPNYNYLVMYPQKIN